MKALVTGAAGFIGQRLVRRLAGDGHAVTVLVRREGAAFDALPVTVVLGDVRDATTMERAAAGVDTVFNLARAKGHGLSTAEELQTVNVDGAAIAAQAAARAGAKRLVHCSSVAVYGSRRLELLREDSELRPDSAYARSKVEAESRVIAHAQSGLNVTIARITAVLGPGSRAWLSIFRSVAARRLPVLGRGDNWHHPADVDDVVEALVLAGASKAPGVSIYNVAGPEAVTLREMLEMIATETGAGPGRTLPRFPFDSWLAASHWTERLAGIALPRVDGMRFLLSNRRFDLSGAAREIGFKPGIGYRQTVSRTAEWYRAEGLLER